MKNLSYRYILYRLKVIKSDLVEQYECDNLAYDDSISDIDEIIEEIEDYLNTFKMSYRKKFDEPQISNN